MRRASGAIGLSFTAAMACADDPLVGEWNATTVGGYPLVSSSNYYDCTFSTSARLDVDADFDAELLRRISYSGEECYYGDEIELYVGDVLRIDPGRSTKEHGHYEIDLEAGTSELSLSCTIDAAGDDLFCRDQIGYAWNFDR